jgi:hypothetical protein
MTALALVPTGTIENAKDLSPRERWETELSAAGRSMDQFEKRAQIAVDRFVDERDAVVAAQKWFNIYKANTEILAAALYADVPEPAVSRRYDDYEDQVARVAALILQRSIKQDINDPQDQFDTTMDNAVQDRLIAGMACAWLRFETETEEIPTTRGGSVTNNSQSTQPHASTGGKHDDGFTTPAGDGPVPLKAIVDQNVVVDYVHWRDFRFSPCRTWEERRWVARRVFMTKEQLTERFGKAKADLTALDWSNIRGQDDPNKNEASREVFKKAQVWEIWDREARKVHWFAPGYPTDLLDTREDFLQLQSFEPCPKPMLANITTSSTVPRPDYYMIQDQYEELNAVNSRVSLLVKACKVVGVYDQGADAVKTMLTGNENTMIPVPNWSQFAEKQGIKGAVDWLPLEQIVAALEQLNRAREVIKGQIYELTGIADIVRGDSKASETLGAQKIKAQFASIRIKKLQKETARFASDILRIKGELAAKHFTPATLIRRSGIVYTDNHEYIVDAITLLKSEQGFNWRIEVQADTMAQADYESEREDRIKFASAVTGYMAQTFPIAGQIPETKPIIMGILKWLIASFKGASDIEGMIDKQLSKLEGKPPPPPQPDPKVQAAQMKAQTDQQMAQVEMQAKQQDAQIKQQQGEQKMSLEQQKAALEQRRMEMELQFEREKMEMERQMHEQEMAFKREEMGLNLQATQAQHQLDMETSQQEAALKMETAMGQQDIDRAKGEQELQLSQQEHAQAMEQSKAQGQLDLSQSKAAGDQKLAQAKEQSRLPRAQAAKAKK